MPTYTNNSTETKIVEDINGVLQHVAPSGSIATYFMLGTDWTETLATPIFNPVIASTAVTLDTTGTEIALDDATISVEITEISNTVTALYTDTAAITPPLLENITSTISYIPTIDLSKFRAKIRKLLIKGSGTCKVKQYRV